MSFQEIIPTLIQKMKAANSLAVLKHIKKANHSWNIRKKKNSTLRYLSTIKKSV